MANKKIRDLTIAEILKNKNHINGVSYEISHMHGYHQVLKLIFKPAAILEEEIELVEDSDSSEEIHIVPNVDFYNGEPFEYHATHNGVDYWIVSNGYYPLAYVQLNQIEGDMIYHDYECHGGITFRGKKEFAEGFEYVIGWDYAHFILNDYAIYLDKTEKDEENLKHWTFDEVEKEVFDFIDKYRIKKEA